jgi:hypothetical protein
MKYTRIKHRKRQILTLTVFLGIATFLAFGTARAQSEEGILLEGPVALSSLAPNANPTVPRDLELTAIVSYTRRGSLTSTTMTGATELMDIQSAESVNIEVDFPSDFANKTLVVEPLDGGSTDVGDEATVGRDGVAQFNFTAGSKPGLYRVRISGGAAKLVLNFWLADTSGSSQMSVLVPTP